MELIGSYPLKILDASSSVSFSWFNVTSSDGQWREYNSRIQEMIEKAEQAGGDTFYRYNAVTANCQRFINVLMNSSGITGTDNFVMQDATQLIN